MSKAHGLFAATLAAAVAGGVSSANAQWFAREQGPDVFGAKNVIAAAIGEQGAGLVVQCNGTDQLLLAFIEPATPSELDQASQMPDGLPAELLIRAGSAPVQKLDAKFRAWNTTHVGVVVQGRTPDLVSIIKAIGVATGDIAVGYEIGDARESRNFSSMGSTDAMKKVVDDCKLDEIGNQQQPPGSGS